MHRRQANATVTVHWQGLRVTLVDLSRLPENGPGPRAIVSEPQRKLADFPADAGDHAAEVSPATHPHLARSSVRVLTVGALGVVFGDIGTSPIYAMRDSVQAIGTSLPLNVAVLAALSLIFWSLMIIVTIKYVTLIMRADNDGEGGVLALAALAHRSHRDRAELETVIASCACSGLALFFSDGMLTPAISVLSAVEGLGSRKSRIRPVHHSADCHSGRLFVLETRGTAAVGRPCSGRSWWHGSHSRRGRRVRHRP